MANQQLKERYDWFGSSGWNLETCMTYKMYVELVKSDLFHGQCRVSHKNTENQHGL